MPAVSGWREPACASKPAPTHRMRCGPIATSLRPVAGHPRGHWATPFLPCHPPSSPTPTTSDRTLLTPSNPADLFCSCGLINLCPLKQTTFFASFFPQFDFGDPVIHPRGLINGGFLAFWWAIPPFNSGGIPDLLFYGTHLEADPLLRYV